MTKSPGGDVPRQEPAVMRRLRVLKRLVFNRVGHQKRDDSVTGFRTQQISETCKVPLAIAEYGARLFHDDYYAGLIGSSDKSSSELFEHFLTEGMAANVPPGPFFDVAHVAGKLAEHDLAPEGQKDDHPGRVFETWLRHGASDICSPTPLFSEAFYNKTYPDVAYSGFDPFYHFLRHGSSEGRSPSRYFLPLTDAMTARGQLSEAPHADLLALMPGPLDPELISGGIIPFLSKVIVPEFVRAQVADLAPVDDAGVVNYFFATGWFEQIRPTPLFNPDHYAEHLAAHNAKASLPPSGMPRYRVHGVTDVPGTETETHVVPELRPGDNAFGHWVIHGRNHQIVPTYLFDEQFYAKHHNDLKTWKGWIFNHFLAHGIREKFRRATPYFDSDWYAKTYELSASKAPIVDFILAGDDNGQQPSPDINLASFPKATSVGDTSRLETAVRELSRKVARLSDGSMADLIAHAASLEPLIMKPDGLRNMRYPPMKCATVPVRERSRKLQAALTRQQYKSIVLIPHCRMSGATRIGGELLQALNDIYADEPVLLVLTDLSVFERPDWFGDNFDLLDFAEIADGLNRNQKQLLLLDLLRGVQPERIVNVNSSLCWDVYETYGKQMKTWAELYVYLFCYDIDPCGNKVGYPIRNLQRVFDHLSGVMVDNSTLAEELKTRYRLPAKLRQRVHTLFTPERPSTHNLSANFARRRSAGGAMRALWAGRFDRQKRFDLVIEIANQMPDLEIWAYGKPVLQDVTYDLDALPRNIRLEEPYKHVDDVPLEIFDFYLYTSEWDGLPTILIEMGMRGMTVVSSDVGGISDLVTPETGWPVADALNPSAYVEAIAELARMPDAATARASALKARVLEMCTHERYLKTARGVFVADRAPMRTASAGHSRVERPLVESLSTSAIQS